MTKFRVVLGFSIAAACAGVLAQEQPDLGGPGWTGLTKPGDVIAARAALMMDIERLMRPIDTYAAGESEDSSSIQSAAETIAVMLAASPHLFPPTTDLYDADAELPETLALPALWQSFDAFYAMAEAATEAARAVASASEAELRSATTALRATCDACHAAYLRPYEPSDVTEDDVDFDFDSVFE